MAYRAVKFIKTLASGGREWQPGMVINEGDMPAYQIESLLSEGAIEPVGFPAVEPEVEAVEPEAVEAEVEWVEPIEMTPAAAELALEHDVDLSEVEGTGQGGRITKADVEAVLGDEE